jgi:hypothetical protein
VPAGHAKVHNPRPLGEYCPATHSVHGVAASQSSSCQPTEQICTHGSALLATHGVDGSASPSWRPESAHTVHEVAPAAAYVPVLHCTHAVVDTVSLSYRPA